MTPSIHAPFIVLLGLVALVAWRMYSRIRRLIGRQRLSRPRLWINACLFPALVLLLAFLSFADLDAVAALVTGVVVGAALGAYGLRLTKFEKSAEGFFYTPSAHIGVALSLLFAGRVLYRIVELYFSTAQTGSLPTDFARSPITLAIFGALAGYYVAYSIGVLLWRRRIAMR